MVSTWYTFADLDEKLYLSERNIYGSSRIGQEQLRKEMVLTPPSNGSNYMAINESGDKMYELSNHLGNVLNVVADRKLPVQLGSTGTVDYYVSNVMSYSDYYPFGMQVPNKHGNVSDFRYGFQGQESDDEVKGDGNSVNYKYRMHDPRLGRFFARDPLERQYAHNSPYAFSENNVIHAFELEGLEMEAAFFGDATNKGTGKLIIVDDKDLYNSYLENAVASTFDILYIAKNESEDAAYSLNMSDYERLVTAYCNENAVELDVLVINCHASMNGITVNYDDPKFPGDRSYSKMGSAEIANPTGNGDGMNKAVDDFIKLVSHVKEGGSLVLAACNIGEDFGFGSNLVNAVENCINVYTNMDNTGVPKSGIIGTPLTTSCSMSGGWLLHNFEGMTTLENAIIVTPDEIIVSDPNPNCVPSNTPEDE